MKHTSGGRWKSRSCLLGTSAVLASALLIAASSAAWGSSRTTAATSHRSKSTYVVALSNSFLGNTWRQTMVDIFESTARSAKAKGLIAGYKVENTSDNTATTQIAQIKSLILEHVNALLIDSASPTALNPVIQQACRAGIKVVVFDSLASAPCEHNLEDSIAAYGAGEAQLVAQCMKGHGNVIVAQGVVGSAPSKTIYDSSLATLKKFPGIKIVSTVIGQASDPITEQVVAGVLPSLPSVQGVITGGSSYGAVQAFLHAGRPLPCAVYDNSGTALRFWQARHQKTGYNAYSLRTEPGQAAAAFWEVLQLLQGKSFPKLLVFPNLEITPKTLNAWIRVTPSQEVSAYQWTEADFNREVSAIAHHKLPVPPIPTSAP